MSTILILLGVGLVAGLLSGLVGIGGGIVIVPVLVYYLQYSQQQAQGTTLFMFLLPIGILGVVNYYKAGYVEWKTACIMAVTFMAGSYFGSKIAISLDQAMIKKIFGAVIVLLGLKMLIWK
ncbi:MAG: TSUP family transporter [Bacteroidia bacterium]